jgi:hypothetical protein
MYPQKNNNMIIKQEGKTGPVCGLVPVGEDIRKG